MLDSDHPPTHPAPPSTRAAPAPRRAAGGPLCHLRQQRRISQLALSLQVGVSQRHLSCIETGRARPSREMLHALLDALDAPLAERNQALLAAGYAPAFAQRRLGDAEMAPVREALAQLLDAHDPAPALVLDDAWNLLQANRGARALMGLVGAPPDLLDGPLNFLQALLAPGGLSSVLANPGPVLAEVWQRAQREAVMSPGLRAVVDGLRPLLPRRLATTVPDGPVAAPLLLTELHTVGGGRLRFCSAFTSFGAPLDVTAASLRVEHFFPVDADTRRAITAAVAALPAA